MEVWDPNGTSKVSPMVTLLDMLLDLDLDIFLEVRQSEFQKRSKFQQSEIAVL